MKLGLALAAIVIALAMIVWNLWSDVSLPPAAESAPQASRTDDTDDDEPEPADEVVSPKPTTTAQAKAPSSQRRTLVPVYDPWASPPPIDPRAPRLPDTDDDAPDEQGAGHRLMVDLQHAIKTCDTKHELQGTFQARILFDGEAHLEVLRDDATPISDELRDCLAAAPLEAPTHFVGQRVSIRMSN